MNRREFLKGMVATGVVASGIGVACGGETVGNVDPESEIVNRINSLREDYEYRFALRGLQYVRENGGSIGGFDEPIVDSNGRKYICVSPCGVDRAYNLDHELFRTELVELPWRIRRKYVNGCATVEDAVVLLVKVGQWLVERSYAI